VSSGRVAGGGLEALSEALDGIRRERARLKEQDEQHRAFDLLGNEIERRALDMARRLQHAGDALRAAMDSGDAAAGRAVLAGIAERVRVTEDGTVRVRLREGCSPNSVRWLPKLDLFKTAAGLGIGAA